VIKPALQGPYHLLPRRLRESLRGKVERRFLPPLPPPDLDQETRDRLADLFAPDVERLRSLTGNAFAGWSV
jgi:hypothetical protein